MHAAHLCCFAQAVCDMQRNDCDATMTAESLLRHFTYSVIDVIMWSCKCGVCKALCLIASQKPHTRSDAISFSSVAFRRRRFMAH